MQSSPTGRATADLSPPSEPAEPTPFDFRSPQFALAARALQKLSGCALAQCRQELFIAEGDVVEAWQVLVDGPTARDTQLLMH